MCSACIEFKRAVELTHCCSSKKSRHLKEIFDKFKLAMLRLEGTTVQRNRKYNPSKRGSVVSPGELEHISSKINLRYRPCLR